MRSDPADPASPTRRRGWLAGLALCLVVGAAVVLVRTTRDQQADPHAAPHAAPHAPRSSQPARAAPSAGADLRRRRATMSLARLQRVLEHGSRRQVVSLAAPGMGEARQELVTMWSNVHRLGISGLSLRYLSDDTPRLSARSRRSLGAREWVARVQVQWHLGSFEQKHSTMQLPFVMGTGSDPARFVTARRGAGRGDPLWLLGPVWARRSADSLVIAAHRGQLSRFSALADRAVTEVRRVLPRWRGRLLVEVPASEHQLTVSRGSEPGRYQQIAAVTTTVDGTASRSAPVHIFVNPVVFDPLGPIGSQIVLSHEATHVATGAALSHLPEWLLEGFADYVALAHVDLPVTVTARQILTLVRRHGPPRHLPGRREFAPGFGQLGASYESAWLACRLLAQQHGQAWLVRFYRRADRESSTAAAFRQLGTSQRGFTRTWRSDLRTLARAAAR